MDSLFRAFRGDRRGIRRPFSLCQLLHETFPRVPELHGQRNGLCNLVGAHLLPCRSCLIVQDHHRQILTPARAGGDQLLASDCHLSGFRRCSCSCSSSRSASLNDTKYSRTTSATALVAHISGSGSGGGGSGFRRQLAPVSTLFQGLEVGSVVIGARTLQASCRS